MTSADSPSHRKLAVDEVETREELEEIARQHLEAVSDPTVASEESARQLGTLIDLNSADYWVMQTALVDYAIGLRATREIPNDFRESQLAKIDSLRRRIRERR